MRKKNFTPWRVGLVLLVVLAAEGALVSLASWQWQRFQTKLALGDVFAAKLAEPLLSASQPIAAEDYWRRALLAGSWLPEYTVYLLNQTHQNRLAVRVYTPLLTPTDQAVWVDRGLLEVTRNAPLPQPAELAPTSPAALSGVLLKPAERKGGIGGPATNTTARELLLFELAALPNLPAPVAPLYLQAAEASHPQVVPQLTTPKTGAGQHLNYFITWATLAVFLPVLLFMRLRRGG